MLVGGLNVYCTKLIVGRLSPSGQICISKA